MSSCFPFPRLPLEERSFRLVQEHLVIATCPRPFIIYRKPGLSSGTALTCCINLEPKTPDF